jgi:hypothetical protein
MEGLRLRHLDYGLRKAIGPLLSAGEYDSVIRKALVHLKTRVCNHLDLPKTLDGDDLVNRVFGKAASLLPDLTPSQRESYRSLFSGMYGLLRNHYMHNDVVVDGTELDVVLANANFLLRLIGDYHLNAVDVLLVEGDHTILNQIKSVLEPMFSFVSATSFDTAMDTIVRVGPPTILVTDRYLGDAIKKRGEDLAAYIRVDEPEKYVIYTLGYYPPERPSHSRDIEFAKPFLLHELLDTVKRAMRLSLL